MQLIVKSLTGAAYVASAQIERNRRVNGERDISLSFLCNEINNLFIADIETGWKVNFQGDWYHLFNEKTDKHGNKSFNAVLDFYYYFNGFWHVDEVQDKSMTALDALTPLFNGKDYVLQIIDNFYANNMTLSRQQNSTERFSYFIDRLSAEYQIPIGTKTVQVRNKIGVRRNDVIIHEDDNLDDLNIDIDSSSFCTAIKGYYNFKKPADTTKGEEAVPTETYDYISPMAEKYGIIWGEPIYDERFKTLDSIKAACKEKQEASYKVSYSIKTSIIGRPFNEGDEVPFIAPSKSISMYLRVVEVKETFDEEGDLIEVDYTFGSQNIATAYRQMQYDAVQDVNDILRGKKPIPASALPKAIREATAVINAGDTTQFYYREDGIYGVNTANPLGVTRYNANGIGFSQDGGQTYQNAMTYLGIVATAITAGTLNTHNVTIQGTNENNYLIIDSSTFTQYGVHTREWRDKVTTHKVRTMIERGHMRFRNDDLQRSLYLSEHGLSTMLDGNGDYMDVDGASGTLMFFDPYYSPSGASGVTLNSHGGVVALSSDLNRIVVEADLSVDISSQKSSIYLRPEVENVGNNAFAFSVVDTDKTGDTDGWQMYGSDVNGYSVGLRYSKNSNDPTIYVVDGDKARGGKTTFDVGNLAVNQIWKRDGSRNVYWNGSSGGTTNNGMELTLFASGIRANLDASDIFLATNSGGSVRVTDSKGYNSGNGITYRDIAASAFNVVSHHSRKSEITPYNEDVLAMIENEWQAYTYKLQDDEHKSIGAVIGDDYQTIQQIINKDGESINLYAAVAILFTAVQQLIQQNNEKVV